jgi:two-component system, LytTR family, sensor kinase
MLQADSSDAVSEPNDVPRTFRVTLSKRFGLTLLAWLGLSLLTTSQGVLTYLATGGQVNVWTTAMVNLVLWAPWALLSPLILAASRRWRLYGPGWPLHAAMHLATNLGLAVVAAMLYRALRMSLGLPVRANYSLLIVSGLNSALIVYWGIVALEHAVAYYRRGQERDRQASEAQRMLSQARLDSLRSQIHPHFLFNTLHAIASRVRQDARGAEDMLGALGDMLRTNLATAGGHETPLREELRLIEQYLAIQTMRFGDRLRIEVDVTSEAREVAVPALLLQPLVENAIEHGIAQRLSGGTLRIEASLSGPQLTIIVSDSGGAHLKAHGTSAKWNVGLTNTRERLQALYGDDQTLQTIVGADGEFKVFVSIPARTLATPAGAAP